MRRKKEKGYHMYLWNSFGAEQYFQGSNGQCFKPMCLQVRSAYRRRGWGFTDPQQISQCAKEGFVEKLKAQEGEGCHMWGTLAVNKASLATHCDPTLSLMQFFHRS